MAFPLDPLDLTAELLIDGTWTDITADVRDAGTVTITRGRRSEGAQAQPTSCELTLTNTDGTYSPRNPLSPYYGKIGRNTQMRVYTGTPHLGAGGGSGTASTSHVAPSVTATGSGLLICGWMSDDPGAYTLPGSMTAGPAETDGTFSTMRTAYESVAAGATGTRTATFDANQGYASVSAVAHGASVAVEETLSGVSDTIDDVTLTTDATTQAGWWLVAVQGWIRGFDVGMPDAPHGDDGGWILLGDSGRIDGVFDASTTVYLRMRVWARRVTTSGAQTVILPGVADASAAVADNHAALYVLSGVDDWSIRATTEVPAWPARWDVTGSQVLTPITGQGILRRLRQGTSPLRSPLYRAITGAGATVHVGGNLLPVTYWTLEDGAGSTQAASGLPSGTPLTATGAIQWGSVESPGSAPLPDWSQSAGSLVGAVAGAVSPGSQWSVGCLVQLTGSTAWTCLSVAVSGGVYSELRLEVAAAGVTVSGVTSSGTSTVVASADNLADGDPHWVEVWATDAVPDGVTHTLYIDGIQADVWVEAGVPGVPTRVMVQPRSSGTAALGHVGIWEDPRTALYPAVIGPAIDGHLGEAAGRRIERLCLEEGITLHLVGDADDTVTMGAQTTATLLDLLRECEDADGGVLYEPREVLGLAYRTSAARCDQPATLALTYGAEGEVAPPLEPVDDDRYTRNDVTATRRGGSSARYEVTSGPLSTQDPPDGVGRYDTAVTVNVESDSQLLDQASWRAHLGTWDEARYPTIRINLAALAQASKTALMEAAAALDVADRVTIDDPPAWLPPDPIDQHVEGYTETLGPATWDLQLVCAPAGPWRVAEVDGDPRVAADGSTLAADITSSATSLQITSTAENGPWTTDPDDFPLDIAVGGERITLSAISGTTSPQTATVSARSVNGVVKAHSAGAPVDVWEPAILPLV